MAQAVQVEFHQDCWAFVEREVLPAAALSAPIVVSPVLPSERDPRASTGVVRIDLTEEGAEQVTDVLLRLFLARGLQPGDEPNDLGRYVEHLIDTFSDA